MKCHLPRPRHANSSAAAQSIGTAQARVRVHKRAPAQTQRDSPSEKSKRKKKIKSSPCEKQQLIMTTVKLLVMSKAFLVSLWTWRSSWDVGDGGAGSVLALHPQPPMGSSRGERGFVQNGRKDGGERLRPGAFAQENGLSKVNAKPASSPERFAWRKAFLSRSQVGGFHWINTSPGKSLSPTSSCGKTRKLRLKELGATGCDRLV